MASKARKVHPFQVARKYFMIFGSLEVELLHLKRHVRVVGTEMSIEKRAEIKLFLFSGNRSM